jgi:hypothetical protein
MNDGYFIGGRTFSTKEDMALFFSNMLESYQPGETLKAKDAKMVGDLLPWHPNYRSKTRGTRIKRFLVAKTPAEGKNGFVTAKCFHFERADGKINHFSYRKCILAVRPE